MHNYDAENCGIKQIPEQKFYDAFVVMYNKLKTNYDRGRGHNAAHGGVPFRHGHGLCQRAAQRGPAQPGPAARKG